MASARLPLGLAALELTTVSQELYTAAASTWAQVCACSVTNKTALPYYVTVTLTPAADTAKYLVYQVVVPPATLLPLSTVIGQVLNPGDMLSALAEANGALDIVVSGFETTP